MDKELFSTEEAARYLGVTATTLREKRKTGQWKIPHVEIGRLRKFAKTDLDAFIEEHRRGS